MSANTASRLREIMAARGLRQSDVLRMAQPYCERYKIKLGKSDLSQFVTGKVAPGQWKLTILGLALNVSEAWLMGLDVPMDRSGIETPPTPEGEGRLPDDERRLLALFHQLNREGRERLVEIADDMVSSGKYIKTDPSTLGVSPA